MMTAPHTPPGEPSRLEVDDEFAQAVIDVAAEMDARRNWKERLRDAVRSARLLVAIICHNKLRSGPG